MGYSYAKDRESFISAMSREYPAITHAEILTLLRAGTAENRWNEIDCSIDIGDRERARQERRSENRLARVKAICDRIGATLNPNGDPRGYAYYITLPSGKTNDLGGRGLGVPGRGLPARCFR